MSKLYNRPRTPPTPPSFSQKSSTSRGTRHDSHKSYDEPSKSYSSRDYEKYSSYDKYGKSEKYDRYDKLDKSSYKSSSYLSSKEYGLDYPLSGLKGTGSTASNQSEKYYGKSSSSRSYHGDDSYRSKERVYVDQSYSDRDPYLSKYPSKSNDKYSKYSPPSTKDISDSKYSKHVMRGSVRNSVENDKYSPYPTTNKSTSLPYSKFGSGSNSFYPKNDSSYGSYDTYDRSLSQSHLGRGKEDREVRGFADGSQRREAGKNYSNSEPSDSYGGGYQRYVIGNSVVYRSPGHYPKDLYPSSPKSKRDRSPHSPAPPLLSSSKIGSSSGKNYSRYSPSPKSYTGSSTKGSSLRGDSSYSRSSQSSSFRKPHSPPPHSYQGLSSHSHSKGDRASNSYTAPPDRGKIYNDRYDMPKGGRFYDQRDVGARDGLKSRDFDSYRKKDAPYSKPYSYDRDSNPMPPRDKYPSERPPAPLMSLKPQPLLSIPLSISSLPLESRANVRETLGIPPHKPLNGMDKGLRGRRLEGRIGSRKRLPLSPKNRKRRRPDDLRLWIEYRKNEGGKTNGASNAKGRGQVKRPGRAIEGATRSRMMDSRKRILNKGKKGGMLRREPRRLPPLKPKSRAHETKSSDTSKKIESSNSTEGRSRDEGSKRRKERLKGGDPDHGRGGESNRGSGSGRASGTTSSVRRPLVKRPKIVSQANRLPLKQRPVKRSSYRSSPDKEKSSSKNDKSYHHSTKSKPRERSRTPPRRAEKEEVPPSSSSRH